MKVDAEVVRVEQVFDCQSRQQQNYLVLDVLGVEVRVPCTEEQMVEVLSVISAMTPEETAEVPQARAPSTFVAEDELGQAEESTEVEQPRKLKALGRRGDDVGIAQG